MTTYYQFANNEANKRKKKSTESKRRIILKMMIHAKICPITPLSVFVCVCVVIKIHCQMVRIIGVVSMVEKSQWVSIPLSAGTTIFCLAFIAWERHYVIHFRGEKFSTNFTVLIWTQALSCMSWSWFWMMSCEYLCDGHLVSWWMETFTSGRMRKKNMLLVYRLLLLWPSKKKWMTHSLHFPLCRPNKQ